MARAPRQPLDENDDPINEAIRGDSQSVASELETVLESLSGVAQGEVKGILFLMPKGGGKFQWIKEILPPFDFNEIMSDLKTKFGGGDFRLSIMVRRKLAKQVEFSIAHDPTAPAPNPLIADKRGDNDMMLMFMQMQQTAADRQLQMMQSQMTAQATAQQNQTQMIMGLATALIPALMGGREKTSELITAFAMMNQKPESTSLKDTVETIAAVKGLLGDGGSGGGGDGDGDLMSQGIRAVGNMIPSLLKALPQRSQAPPPEAGSIVPALPAPVPQPAPIQMPGLASSDQTLPGNLPGAGAEPSKFPVLDVVRDDVLFMFKRGRSPEIAAEHVLGVLDAEGVEDAEIWGLVGDFQASENWLEDLASAGIDLRSNPEWAIAFLGALVQLYTQDDGDNEHSGGGAGGETDAGNHGDTGQAGLPIPRDSGES